MDPTSTVRTDALPAIATLVIPGGVAATPYAWLLLDSAPFLAAYFHTHDSLAVLVGVLVAVGMGFALESAGSYVEVHWIDHRRRDSKKMLDTWWRYLRTTWDREPIGQRYLRRLLVSFKFELNMFVGTLAAMPGVLLLAATGRTSSAASAWTFTGLIVVAWLLFRASRDSADVLAKVRDKLVWGESEPPLDKRDGGAEGSAGSRMG